MAAAGTTELQTRAPKSYLILHTYSDSCPNTLTLMNVDSEGMEFAGPKYTLDLFIKNKTGNRIYSHYANRDVKIISSDGRTIDLNSEWYSNNIDEFLYGAGNDKQFTTDIDYEIEAHKDYIMIIINLYYNGHEKKELGGRIDYKLHMLGGIFGCKITKTVDLAE